jgi:predicted negative regulator of RcsB-dependent stress response
MDIYASDDEKAEEIKQWWRDNGRSVIIGVLFGAVAIFGYKYWMNYQNVQTEQASLLFQQTLEELSTNNIEPAQVNTDVLKAQYANTAYATFSALQLARQQIEQGDNASAKAQLEWVAKESKLAGLRDLARIRLAKMIFNENQYEQALAVINQTETQAYASLSAELEGDIAKQQGQIDVAHAAYQRAISTLPEGDTREMLLQLKLDDVAI